MKIQFLQDRLEIRSSIGEHSPVINLFSRGFNDETNKQGPRQNDGVVEEKPDLPVFFHFVVVECCSAAEIRPSRPKSFGAYRIQELFSCRVFQKRMTKVSYGMRSKFEIGDRVFNPLSTVMEQLRD